jgi:hypothetical protein
MSQEDVQQTRIENLKKVQAVRKKDSLSRVNQAIESLSKKGGKINFNTVAREANVSVSYLYKYPELKECIAMLRNKQSSMPYNSEARSVSSHSYSKVIDRFKERICKLEEQNRELRRKNEALAGQVYRTHNLQEQVERQQQTIEDLQTRLKEAQAQVSVSKVTPINPAKTLQEISSISKVEKSAIADRITDRIKDELDRLGIKLNSTLTRIIKTADEETVLEAITALEEEMKTNEVGNPGGFLFRAIKERWVKSDPPQQQQQRQPEIYTASPEPDEDLVPLEQLKKLFGGLDE